MLATFRVLFVEREDRGLLVARNADHIADERQCGSLDIVAMYEAAGIQATQFEHHVLNMRKARAGAPSNPEELTDPVLSIRSGFETLPSVWAGHAPGWGHWLT